MAESTAADTIPKKPSRLLALDWFRFLAVALMVQGHTFYEVLEQSVKDADWYSWHRYVHGFTAPMFYFSSGLAFGVTTLRGFSSHFGLTSASKKRYERYAMLLLIGYGMQAGDFSARALVTGSDAARAAQLAVNTLQNIGVTLLLAQLLVAATRTVARYRVAILALAAFFVLLAPLAWRADLSRWPVAIAAYVTDRTGSLFPLFPWSGYALAGILVAIGLTAGDGRSIRADAPTFLLRVGLVLAVVGKLFGELQRHGPLDLFGPHNYWKTSPFFFLQRLGMIVLVFAALAIVERRASPIPSSRALRTIENVAQETLVIYVGHLLLLYGTPWAFPGLKGLFPETLALGGSILAFLLVFVAMAAFATAWHTWKKSSPTTFDRARYAAAAVLVAVYLLNPGPTPAAPSDRRPTESGHDARSTAP